MSILIILHGIGRIILSFVQIDSILDEESRKVKDGITLRHNAILGVHTPMQTKPRTSFTNVLLGTFSTSDARSPQLDGVV